MAVFKVENVEDLYEIGDVLGSGHFGQVRHVREKATGTPWAGKFLKIRKNATSRLGLERKAVEREVEVLQSLQHTNIMALKDVFESRAEVVLIVELISGGELFDFIAEKENLSETDAIEFMVQILKAVGFMHSKHFAHFDLKPENIMLLDKVVPHPHIKLIDFGLAQRLDEAVEFKSLCGTPQYIGGMPGSQVTAVAHHADSAPGHQCGSPLGQTFRPQPPLLSPSPRAVFPGQDLSLCPSSAWGSSIQRECPAVLTLSLSARHRPVLVSSRVCWAVLCFYYVDLKLSQGWGPCFDPGSVCLPVSRDRMTAEECLVHPWIKPLSRKQADNRSRSSINMKSFRRFNARRKWKGRSSGENGRKRFWIRLWPDGSLQRNTRPAGCKIQHQELSSTAEQNETGAGAGFDRGLTPASDALQSAGSLLLKGRSFVRGQGDSLTRRACSGPKKTVSPASPESSCRGRCSRLFPWQLDVNRVKDEPADLEGAGLLGRTTPS
nr:PREDICTED: uncharacterized protein LOC102690036 [Lepisosteus oculatus]